MKAEWASSQEEFLQLLTKGGGVNRLSENLLAFDGAGVPADPMIDSAVVFLAES